MKYASNDPRPLSDIAVIDQQSLDYIVENIEVPGAMWGNITGTLSAQTDLDLSLAGKSPTSHNHSGVYENAGAVASHASVHAPANAQPNNISDVNAGLLTGGQQTNLHSHASSGSIPTSWGKYF
jgi:hypothetical protein